MSGLLTSEMSAYKAGYGNMYCIIKEVSYAVILPKTRTGAGNESARCNSKGDKRKDPLDAGSRDTWYLRQADEKNKTEI